MGSFKPSLILVNAFHSGSSGVAPRRQHVQPTMKPFTETERQEFLAAKHVGMLSVAAADGRPPASVPIWYDYTLSGNIRINTGAGARKAKLIERAGGATFVVQREEPPYQYVVVEAPPSRPPNPPRPRYGKPSLSATPARQVDASSSAAWRVRRACWSPSTAGSPPISLVTSEPTLRQRGVNP